MPGTKWWPPLLARFRPRAEWETGLFDLRRSRLRNGPRVWVKPRSGTGTVLLLLQVPVRSRHETEANNGISHFVEHLLFTGTQSG